jgi:hypothetical protein
VTAFNTVVVRPRGAYALVYRTVQRQAMALAYIDTYWMLAIGAAIMCALSLFLKKNVAPRNGAV